MTREQDLATKTCRLSIDQRYEVISRYGRVLEKTPSPVGREADLPYPKGMIRKAICEELCENPDSEQRSFLEIAFAQLECFLPPDEFKVVSDFKHASSRAQELAKSGKPKDIIASADILDQVDGDRAIGIFESISKKIRRRLLEIRAIRLSRFSSKGC